MSNTIKKDLLEALILKADRPNKKLVVVSNETDPKKASQETFRSKEKLKKDGFAWDGAIKAWVTDEMNFEKAKSTLSDINKTEGFIQKLEDIEDYVSSSENFNGKDNLMDKIHLYVDDLANVTDEATMSAEIRRYLSFFARFRNHSFTNTFLIYIQNPKATRVAGFKQWETKFHRRVKKGASGMMIFAPIIKKVGVQQADDSGDDGELDKDVSGQQRTIMRFKPVWVFDIADTEAIDERGDVPQSPEWFSEVEPTELTEKLYDYLAEMCENMGINLSQGDANGKERGYSAGNHINMSSNIKGAGEVSTLVHEIAHELMHWKNSSIYYQGDDVRRDSRLCELQAESVSYVVMKHFNLPVQHHPTYLALWKANKEKILANIKVISEVAKFIIDGVNTIEKADETLQSVK